MPGFLGRLLYIIEKRWYEPSQVRDSYGCCGQWAGMNLARYDTINELSKLVIGMRTGKRISIPLTYMFIPR